MQSETSSNVMADINVTPMVDVMLVLLIIFMVVTPALLAGFQAQLPQGTYLKERPEEEARTVLGIDRSGQYYVNKRPVARENVPTLLQQEFNAHPADKVLFVKADRELQYGEIMRAMDMARTAGARVVAAVAEQYPSEDGKRKGR